MEYQKRRKKYAKNTQKITPRKNNIMQNVLKPFLVKSLIKQTIIKSTNKIAKRQNQFC
ncbi:hypothetical protein [Helicobacter sp. T3_23-1059]